MLLFLYVSVMTNAIIKLISMSLLNTGIHSSSVDESFYSESQSKILGSVTFIHRQT